MSDDSSMDDIPDDGDTDDGDSFNKYFLFLIVAAVVAITVGYLWWRRRRNLLRQRKHRNDVRAICRDIESSARGHEHRWNSGGRRSSRLHGLRSGRFTRNNAWGLHDIPEIPPSYEASVPDKEIPSTSSSESSRDDNSTLQSAAGVIGEAASTANPPAYANLSTQHSATSDAPRPPPPVFLPPPNE